jgi:spermidine/putrescine transport system permease protein
MTFKAIRRPWALLTPTWLALGVFFLAPLAIMLLISFAQRGTYGGIEPVGNLWSYVRSGAFIDNYRDSLRPIYLNIFWRSFWLAVVTTVLCVIVSYPVAYYIAVAANPRHKNLLLALVVIPFWTSFLIRTYAWMLILRTEGLINTALLGMHVIHQPLPLLDNDFAVLIGLVYGELPFMILPLYASLEKLDRTLLEAAGDLGASGAAAFGRVTLPLTMPGIVAGVVLVFIPSLGQFIVSDLLGGAKSILVGNLIQNQFTSMRNKPFGSAVAFELTAVVLGMLVVYAAYARKKGESLL